MSNSESEAKAMGEAKRRSQLDPSFGTKQKESLLQKAKTGLGKVSTLELMLWTVIIVSSVTTAIWSFTR